jgi:hypothetical protein
MFTRLLRRPPALSSADAVRDPAYWLGLHPAGRISLQPRSLPQPAAAPAAPVDVSALARDGHVTLPALWDAATVASVLDAAQAVFRAGWPGACALLFDQVWESLWQPAFHHAVHAQLGGPDVSLVPLFHVHHVAAVEGARGWAPHVDYREDVSAPPLRLTAWLTLTDATLANGCMHVVPPGVRPQLVAKLPDLTTLSVNDALELLHHVRALPTSAGDLLCWRPGVLHFGGVATAAAHAPRWALSTEWARLDAPAAPDRPAPLPRGWIPGFAQRLELVTRSLEVFWDPARESQTQALDLLRQR